MSCSVIPTVYCHIRTFIKPSSVWSSCNFSSHVNCYLDSVRIKFPRYKCTCSRGKYKWALGNFTPWKNSPRLQCKTKSLFNRCRLGQWDVKSSPPPPPRKWFPFSSCWVDINFSWGGGGGAGGRGYSNFYTIIKHCTQEKSCFRVIITITYMYMYSHISFSLHKKANPLFSCKWPIMTVD